MREQEDLSEHSYVTAQDGTRLSYESKGEGPLTLVLCDGVGCAGYIWKYLIPYFASSFRILHSQYRGHGRSGCPEDLASLTIEQLAEDLADVVHEAAPQDDLVLIGHSMGVQVALEYYKRRPTRIRALVLINGPYGHALRHVHGTPLFAHILPSLRSLLKRWEPWVERYWKPLMESEVSYAAALAFEVNPHLTKRKDFRPYFKELGAMDPEVLFTAIHYAEQHSAWNILRAIDVGVLVVAGEKDRFTPFAVMKRMFHAIPGAELLVLPTASHIGPLELPELLNLRLEKFLRTQIERKPPRTR